MECPMCGKEYTDNDIARDESRIVEEKDLIINDPGLENIDLPEG